MARGLAVEGEEVEDVIEVDAAIEIGVAFHHRLHRQHAVAVDRVADPEGVCRRNRGTPLAAGCGRRRDPRRAVPAAGVASIDDRLADVGGGEASGPNNHTAIPDVELRGDGELQPREGQRAAAQLKRGRAAACDFEAAGAQGCGIADHQFAPFDQGPAGVAAGLGEDQPAFALLHDPLVGRVDRGVDQLSARGHRHLDPRVDRLGGHAADVDDAVDVGRLAAVDRIDDRVAGLLVGQAVGAVAAVKHAGEDDVGPRHEELVVGLPADHELDVVVGMHCGRSAIGHGHAAEANLQGGEHRREVHRVVALAGVFEDGVAAEDVGEGIHVVAGAAREGVGAEAAAEGVVAGEGRDRVVAGVALEEVALRGAVEGVVAVASLKPHRLIARRQAVALEAADHMLQPADAAHAGHSRDEAGVELAGVVDRDGRGPRGVVERVHVVEGHALHAAAVEQARERGGISDHKAVGVAAADHAVDAVGGRGGH